MPIYEYVCVDCGQRFDALRQMRDADTPIPCQRCGSQQTNRVLTTFFAQSSGHAVAGSGGGCGGCSGGSCGSCGHH